MIHRIAANTLQKMARGYYVVTVTGPRQSGKTTLVQAVFANKDISPLRIPMSENLQKRIPAGFYQGVLEESYERSGIKVIPWMEVDRIASEM